MPGQPKTYGLQVVFLVLTLVACNDTSFNSREHLAPPPEKTESDAAPVQSASQGETVSSLRVGTNSQIREEDDPVELLFVLDNSRSMTDNIVQLKSSVSDLFKALQAEKIRYRVRIVTLERFLAQLVPSQKPPGVAPKGVFDGATPTYDRGAEYESHYLEVPTFSHNAEISKIETAIEDAINTELVIHDEPGICTALDFIQWSTKSPVLSKRERLGPESKIHVVMLSDEENSTKITKINPITNEVIREDDLYCYQRELSRTDCKAYNIMLEWQAYGYRYREPDRTEYQYKVKTAEASACQIQNEALFPSGVDQLLTLETNRVCENPQVECDNKTKSTPTNFACTAGELKTNSKIDLTGKFQCEDLQNFSCTIPAVAPATVSPPEPAKIIEKTVTTTRAQGLAYLQAPKRFECNVPEEGTRASYLSLETSDLTGKGSLWCEHLNEYECTTVMPDGKTVTELKPRSFALPVLEGKTANSVYDCKADGYATISDKDLNTSQHCEQLETFECQVWQDNKEKIYQLKTRAEAIAIINAQPAPAFSCSAKSVKNFISPATLTAKGRCSVAQKWMCQAFEDNKPGPFRPVSRDVAMATIAANNELKCQVAEDPGNIEQDFLLSASEYNNAALGVTACEAYTCTDESAIACREAPTPTWTPINIANNEPILQSQSKYFLRKCSSLQCTRLTSSCREPQTNAKYVEFRYKKTEVDAAPAYKFIKNCAAITCSALDDISCRAADGATWDGGIKTIADKDILKRKFADGTFHQRNCSPYSCEANTFTLAREKLDKAAAEAKPEIYVNCSATTAKMQPKFSISRGQNDAFQGINAAVCATAYGANFSEVETTYRAIDDKQVCGSLLAAKQPTLPVGVKTKVVGESKATTKDTVTDWLDQKYDAAKMATKLGVRTSAILTLEETSRITRGKSIEEFYTFPRYPDGDPFRAAATGFEEIKDGPFVGPQKVLLNSPDYFGSIFPRDGGANVRLERESTQWSKLVKETKLDDPNGYLKDCDSAGVKVETYRGTPEDFMAAHTSEFPKRTLTWNSIVHFASDGCAGKEQSNVSEGAQYRQLTKLTKGVEADICDESTENLKAFIRALARKVIEEIDLVYPLPAGAAAEKLASIFNRTRNLELQPGRDYKVIDGSVVFTAESVGKDDDIEMRFRK